MKPELFDLYNRWWDDEGFDMVRTDPSMTLERLRAVRQAWILKHDSQQRIATFYRALVLEDCEMAA